MQIPSLTIQQYRREDLRGAWAPTAQAGTSTTQGPCILWDVDLSFQTEKQNPQRLHKFQLALLSHIYYCPSVFLLSGDVIQEQETHEAFESRNSHEDPLGDVKGVRQFW